MYEWLDLLEPDKDIFAVSKKVWNGKRWECRDYRYANDVLTRDSDDALHVNWFDDIGALTRYLCFESWSDMLEFIGLSELSINIPH
ncbi:MAG: hypothetical protein GY866_27845 [Proteobacteria bacterium]|nr:hypothetical protein [Pseudomonadota bacterium]